MDKKLFEQKLSEVADWHIPKVTEVIIPRRKGRPRQEDHEHQQQLDQWLQDTDGVNQTLPPKILKIKHSQNDCEFCGRSCAEGQHIETKLYFTAGQKYWRSRCTVCGLYQNPVTKQFDLNGTQACRVWDNYLRKTKMAYNSKYNKIKASFCDHSHCDDKYHSGDT